MEYKEVTKQEYEELFKWIFGENVKIMQEQDIAMAPFYEDINIYYTEEIYNLFQTQAMKRLGKIMQLGSEIFFDSNSYHTRLEHSKGAYRNCIEFLGLQYRNPKWRKYIEENALKGYLVEKIKFMCIHDIGHSMFSHSIEDSIGNKSCTHEDIGKKIIQENIEIKNTLEKIRADEENCNLNGDGSLENFCEGNIDFDRMDFLLRDSLYLGKKDIDNLTPINLQTKCNLRFIKQEGTFRYVYQMKDLPKIEEFLKQRDKVYKTNHKSKKTKITDKLSSYLVNQIKEGKIENTSKLQEYLNHIVGITKEELDIEDFLKTNDIMFFNQLIDNTEKIENNELLNCVIPTNQALLQIAISFLDPKNTNYSQYNEEQKEFIENIRNLIYKRKNNSKLGIDDIVLSVETKKDKRQEIVSRIKDILDDDTIIYDYQVKFNKYNKEEPIYVEDEKSGEIYTLDKCPNLKIDLNCDYKYGVYLIIPELKEKGVSQDKIDKIKDIMGEYQIDEEIEEDTSTKNRMNMFKTQHNNIDYSNKMNKYFDEAR